MIVGISTKDNNIELELCMFSLHHDYGFLQLRCRNWSLIGPNPLVFHLKKRNPVRHFVVQPKNCRSKGLFVPRSELLTPAAMAVDEGHTNNSNYNRNLVGPLLHIFLPSIFVGSPYRGDEPKKQTPISHFSISHCFL